MWLYKDKVINCIDLMPQDVFGFIYQVTYLPTNEKYLGKKFVYFNKKLPPLKGFKRKRKISIESDWKKYYGSHDKIKSLLKENKHDDFKREILEFAFNKKQLTYLETKYLFNNNVLENNEFINDNILGKFFRKDLV
tara:strand:- start:386 stop:793 length:408 start_codon:yes stop_codon:yes gene_type:complete